MRVWLVLAFVAGCQRREGHDPDEEEEEAEERDNARLNVWRARIAIVGEARTGKRSAAPAVRR